MNVIIEWIAESLNISEQLAQNVLVTMITLLAIWLLRKVILNIVYRRTDDFRLRYNWNKGTVYVSYVLIVIFVGRIWFEGVSSLATYLGLLSAGLAVALKDPIANLAAWLFILWRRPFEVGDRVEVDRHAGDVIDQRLFNFTLLEIGNWVDADQSTGRIIHVPNGKIFIHDVCNYTRTFPFIWDELDILITFESDWRKAKSIVQSIADQHDDLQEGARERLREASSKYMIFYNKLTPKVYTSVRDSGVMLQIRYLCEPRRRRMRKEMFWEAILEAFEPETSIAFAYPTQRFVAHSHADSPSSNRADDSEDEHPF